MSEFKPPFAYIGQIVYWKHSPDSKDVAPALVTAAGVDVLGLAVFHPGMHNHYSYDGVRHESDERWRTGGNLESGVWCHIPAGNFGRVSQPLKEEASKRG